MLDQELSRLPEKIPGAAGAVLPAGADPRSGGGGPPLSRSGPSAAGWPAGRDLLRKRLTRRGFAPTAMGAFLGGDPTLPARLLVATVPPPMAAATVRAALGFGSSSILKAGAVARWPSPRECSRP